MPYYSQRLESVKLTDKFTSETNLAPILYDDDQRLKSLVKKIQELKKAAEDAMTPEEIKLDKGIQILKKIGWLSSAISDQTKYSSDLEVYINANIWRQLEFLPVCFNRTRFEEGKLLLRTNDMFKKIIAELEGLASAIEGNVSINIDNKYLSELLDDMIDSFMIDELFKIISIFEKIDFSQAHQKLIALRLIEVAGEIANTLSDKKKNAEKDIPWEELIYLRNRIQHQEDNGSDKINKIIENRDNILFDICAELLGYIRGLKTSLPYINKSSKLTSYVNSLKKNFFSNKKNTQAKIDIEILKLNLPKTKLENAYILLSSCLLKGKIQDMDVLKDALALIGIEKGIFDTAYEQIKNIEAYKKLSFEQKLDILSDKSLVVFREQLIRNELLRVFEKQVAVTSFFEKNKLVDYLNCAGFNDKEIEMWVNNYEALSLLATNKDVELEKFSNFDIGLIESSKGNKIICNNMSSYLKAKFIEIFIRIGKIAVNQDNILALNNYFNDAHNQIFNWYTKNIKTSPENWQAELNKFKIDVDSFKGLYDLLGTKNKTVLEVDTCWKYLLKIPGYTEFILIKVCKRELGEINFSRYKDLLEASKIYDHQQMNVFFNFYRDLNKLPTLHDLINKTKNEIEKFKEYTKLVLNSVDQDEVMRNLGCEYHLEKIIGTLDEFMKQPEWLYGCVADYDIPKLLSLKYFRNDLAHKFYKVDASKTNWIAEQSLLYLIADLEQEVFRLQKGLAGARNVQPFHEPIPSVALLRRKVLKNHKIIMDLLFAANISTREIYVIGQAVGCNIGDQRVLVTLICDFVNNSNATIADKLQLESDIYKETGLTVSIYSFKEYESLKNQLLQHEIAEIEAYKQPLFAYIKSEEYVQIYVNSPTTQFYFKNENLPRKAKDKNEAAIAQRIGYSEDKNYISPFRTKDVIFLRRLYKDSLYLYPYFTNSYVDGMNELYKMNLSYIINIITSAKFKSVNLLAVFSVCIEYFKSLNRDFTNEINLFTNLLNIRNEFIGIIMNHAKIAKEIDKQYKYLEYFFSSIHIADNLSDNLACIKTLMSTIKDIFLIKLHDRLNGLGEQQRRNLDLKNNWLEKNNTDVNKIYKLASNAFSALILNQPFSYINIYIMSKDRIESRQEAINNLNNAIANHIRNNLEASIHNLAKELVDDGKGYYNETHVFNILSETELSSMSYWCIDTKNKNLIINGNEALIKYIKSCSHEKYPQININLFNIKEDAENYLRKAFDRKSINKGGVFKGFIIELEIPPKKLVDLFISKKYKEIMDKFCSIRKYKRDSSSRMQLDNAGTGLINSIAQTASIPAPNNAYNL